MRLINIYQNLLFHYLQITSSDEENASFPNSSNSLQKKNKNFTLSQKQENILLSAVKNLPQEIEESEENTSGMAMFLQIESSDDEASGVVNSTSNNKRKKKDTQLQKQENVILSTNKNMKMAQKDEESEVYGRSIGFQIKDLNKRQLTIAQKLISDVIFYAKLDQLTESSYVVRKPTNDRFHRHQNQTYKGSPPSNCSSPSPSQ